MKEEIEKKAIKFVNDEHKYADESYQGGVESGFIGGYDQAISDYQGISPSTVTEMIEALQNARDALYLAMANDDPTNTFAKAYHIANGMLSKVDKEL